MTDQITLCGVYQSDVDEATNGMSIKDMAFAEDRTGMGLGYLCRWWVDIGKPLPFNQFLEAVASWEAAGRPRNRDGEVW